ncbi:hypothetical protein HanRHA438_Chr04g0176021 [Helianthus annuus]|uniref:Uncharacterized protein n=1 Tax=Helianthus annuus TaxID=4232 RepID=A0A251UYR2_HELAN|nr:uncharacterized protein At4g00950 [Helianthus annuus]KAF5810187.1 hypothetical protein HanXRQr2_Chr04g0166461 [Helianthus annuus]KAJ0581055.1 hypothetical protein HanHA300_Chr04g0136561 [Helianthus annuus]KAJ0588847.1 hypothetical protein HanIR_Chr04g0179421 [Helianthus annuus]KAJ0597000.1 hypothetical protein HanHA89_Chr04g0149501 [Helianthus annuus]KAJ0757681.1 hypothetical protein HanLR1_Chr04g0141601 [Helianthus annuus]
MDIPAPELEEAISTPPKLSLFSLPSKPLTLLPEGLTPPLNTMAAIPFLWEEAPGKPRSTVADDPPKSKTVRSLELPPRLATLSPTGDHNHRDKLGNINVGLDVIPSPTTVLGGPYEGALEEKAVVVGSKTKGGRVRMPLRKLMRKERSSFRSWRWDNKDIFRDDIDDGGGGDRSPSIRFCSWRWDSFRDTPAAAGGGHIGIKRNSFATFNNASTSGFLASMYGTFKQAMPWRSRRL